MSGATDSSRQSSYLPIEASIFSGLSRALRMFRFKSTSFVIHLTGWLLFLSLPLLFMYGPQEADSFVPLLGSPYYWQFCLCYIVLFYTNTHYLFPRFFLKKKYWQFTLLAGLLLGVIYLIKPFDQLLRHYPGVEKDAGPRLRGVIPPPGQLDKRPGPPPGKPGRGPFAERLPHDSPTANPAAGKPKAPRPRPLDVTSIFIFLIIMALSTATRTVGQWQDTEKRAAKAEADKAKAETDKAQAELSVLKAQIHPHFLFNTLNNLYSLAVTGSDRTAASIMKLSNLMRYVTDEVNADFVPLQSEVQCISDYIELQRLRLNQKTKVDWEVAGDLVGKQIAPLLLIPFVENVFKHGVSNHTPSTITIQLQAEENTIRFFCQNKVFPVPSPSERIGVGLANTRQRLAHLYPGKHTLHTGQELDVFTVELILQT